MKTLIGLLVATTLAIGSGCVKQDWIDRTLVTVDVTGTWVGSTENAWVERGQHTQDPLGPETAAR